MHFSSFESSKFNYEVGEGGEKGKAGRQCPWQRARRVMGEGGREATPGNHRR